VRTQDDENYCEYCGCDIGWGSHYHCYKCNGTCSMMGHLSSHHFVAGVSTKVASHYCCPNKCELDNALSNV